MQKKCQACEMPLEEKEDFAGEDETANLCCFCGNADGSMKTCKEIFEGGVQFFLSQLKGDREMAEKITRKNMNTVPYWQDKDCEILKGEMATDEEFAEAMKKLG